MRIEILEVAFEGRQGREKGFEFRAPSSVVAANAGTNLQSPRIGLSA